MRLFAPRTVTVRFAGNEFQLPRKWKPDQVAEFLTVWMRGWKPTGPTFNTASLAAAEARLDVARRSQARAAGGTQR